MTICDTGQRNILLARLRRVTPETKPAWGKLTAHGMICHLGDQMAVALGDAPSRRRGNVITRTLVKWMVIYLPIPIPKGKVRTVSEMLATQPGDWDEDLTRVEALAERLGKAKSDETSPHPVFGPLDIDEWGRLAALHMDHHLRQFGV